MSPLGKWVFTANLEQSTQPFSNAKQGFYASLTLLRLDSESGFLEQVGNYSFDGILPESTVFDNSSRYLALAPSIITMAASRAARLTSGLVTNG